MLGKAPHFANKGRWGHIERRNSRNCIKTTNFLNKGRSRVQNSVFFVRFGAQNANKGGTPPIEREIYKNATKITQNLNKGIIFMQKQRFFVHFGA